MSTPGEKGARARAQPAKEPAARAKRAAGGSSKSGPASGADSSSAPAASRPSHWLFKTEPTSFSFDDLWSAPKRTTGWSGVRNHQAKLYLRDVMRMGDLVLVYHSSAEPTGVAGIARIASAARPDATQFDPADDHFDAKSTRASPTWWEVEIRAVARCPRFVTLAEIRANPDLAGMALLQRGQRLSIQPVESAHFARVLALTGLRAADLAR